MTIVERWFVDKGLEIYRKGFQPVFYRAECLRAYQRFSIELYRLMRGIDGWHIEAGLFKGGKYIACDMCFAEILRVTPLVKSPAIGSTAESWFQDYEWEFFGADPKFTLDGFHSQQWAEYSPGFESYYRGFPSWAAPRQWRSPLSCVIAALFGAGRSCKPATVPESVNLRTPPWPATEGISLFGYDVRDGDIYEPKITSISNINGFVILEGTAIIGSDEPGPTEMMADFLADRSDVYFEHKAEIGFPWLFEPGTSFDLELERIWSSPSQPFEENPTGVVGGRRYYRP